MGDIEPQGLIHGYSHGSYGSAYVMLGVQPVQANRAPLLSGTAWEMLFLQAGRCTP